MIKNRISKKNRFFKRYMIILRDLAEPFPLAAPVHELTYWSAIAKINHNNWGSASSDLRIEKCKNSNVFEFVASGNVQTCPKGYWCLLWLLIDIDETDIDLLICYYTLLVFHKVLFHNTRASRRAAFRRSPRTYKQQLTN